MIRSTGGNPEVLEGIQIPDARSRYNSKINSISFVLAYLSTISSRLQEASLVDVVRLALGNLNATWYQN